jgi:AcrR family transcriptional regulator
LRNVRSGMARTIRDPKARERIVDAAALAVAQHGVRGASMRVIAARAGVSTGFITHYFADKDEVVGAVLDATNRGAARRVLRAIRTDGTALERLAAAADTLLPLDRERRREWGVWVAVWTEASNNTALSAGYRAGWNGLRDILGGLLAEAQEEKATAADIDPEYRADRLVTLLAGIGLLAGVERPAAVRELARRMLADELAHLGDPQPA